MNTWLPTPLLSLFLLLMWVLLNQSIAPGTWLIGAILAIVAPRLAGNLLPESRARIYRPGRFFRLLVWAVIEIVRSCIGVCWIIVTRRSPHLNSQFILVPLDIQDPYGLAVMAALINSTPGTVWIETLPESGDLSLHVLDLHDEQWWIETIKNRYEKPLMEIFEPPRGEV